MEKKLQLSMSENYEEILRRNNGLLTVNCKLPVKDRYALSLIYTPGVGQCCKLIESNPQRAYDLTNKHNSILIVTDSSDLKANCTNSLIGFPYLEAFCVYYKTIANIDAYPIVIDINQITSKEELESTVKAIMPAYSCVEFFGVTSGKLMNFLSNQENNSFATIGTKSKRLIDETLSKFQFINPNHVNSNLIYSGILRAALDLQIYMNLDECVEYVIKYLSNKKERDENIFTTLTEIIKVSCEYFTEKVKLSKEKKIDVLKKFTSFILEGKKAWIKEYPSNFLAHKNTINDNSVLLHTRYNGVIETGTKIEIKDVCMFSELISWENLDYISRLIEKDPDNIYSLTCKSNLASIITNGTAILGFGTIGAVAGLPVMEGKCVLFKLFGGTNVFPLCIEEKDPDKLISIIKKISPTFSAINLEDIKAPECFHIESTLIESLPYPVFHDDQHGTAIVVLAGILNALKLTKKKIEEVKIVMNGAGAAGLSVTELLITSGAKNIIICDTIGAIYSGRKRNMNQEKEKLAKLTNHKKIEGQLSEVIKGADIFIGVSVPGTLTKEMIKTMNTNPTIFALANPIPEIMPDEAKKAGAFIVATGRSDFNNQVNNSLAFPGIFRAVIDVRAKRISINMKIAASTAIANLIPNKSLNPDYIIPDSLDSKVPVAVANAVAKEALNSNLALNKEIDQEHVEDNFVGWLLEEKLRNWKEISQKKNEFIGNILKPKF